jgi:hypothetical protein
MGFKLKSIGRILLTNWIHIVGFYVVLYLYGIASKLIGVEGAYDTWEWQIVHSLWTILLAFLLYGLPIIAGFYLVLLFLDFVLFRFSTLKPWMILLIEWSLIVPIFIYWAFLYEFWTWLVLALSFLVTQVVRLRWIQRPIQLTTVS